MKNLRLNLMLATALVAGVAAVSFAAAPALAADTPSATTDPGFVPGTGQINPGDPQQAPSSSIDIRKIPTPAEARAALLASDDPNPVAGQELVQATSSGGGAATPTTAPSGSGDPTTATGGQAAIGGPLTPGASAGGANGSSPGGSSQTTGARPASAAKAPRSGPIGATGQTMPSKFSERNDVLDRVPIMAWPSRLTDQDRQSIYRAVMADKSQPAAGADQLAPASELSTDQALHEVHALPESLRGIAGISGLLYVKSKDKVFLVTPATRTVVEEIAS